MTTTKFDGFDPSLLRFLKQIKRNNNRDWFQKNKQRYEQDLLEPCLSFIRAFEPRLNKLSPFFVAKASRTGGSLMRIYRDTRFSKDKQPYKTNVGIHFRHQMCGDVHAPGFYVHIEPGECFLGAGIWHPDSRTLAAIRAAIDADPAKWRRTRDDKKFRSQFELAGESLKTNPRGYDKEHPLIDDLRRKDHVAVRRLADDEVLDKRFLDAVATSFSSSRPYARFLCTALNLPI